MIDTEGVIVKPKLLNQQLINLLVLSAYLLSSSTVSIIIISVRKKYCRFDLLAFFSL